MSSEFVSDRDWAEFKAKLKQKTEIDLDLYKAAQMQRRISNLVKRNDLQLTLIMYARIRTHLQSLLSI